MIKARFISYFISGLLIISGLGCVTRTINIETLPSDASVYIDDKYIGKSPVSVPFTHYGTRKITIEKKDDDGRLILKRKVSLEKIKAPVYEIFPLDFISEIILPIKLEDKHVFKYELEGLEKVSIEDRKKQMLLNAEKLKEIASDM